MKFGYLLKITLLAAIYVGAAKVGLMFPVVGGNVTMVWPPTGIALAALLLFGHRLWPGVAIGAFVATTSTGAPLGFVLATAIGNPLAALAGAYLLQRIGFHNALARVHDVAGLILWAAGLSTLLSATIGVAGLCVTGMAPWSAYISIWWPWWLGDAMGALIVAPVLLTWGTRPIPMDDWSAAQWLEAGAALLAGLATSLVAFGNWRISGSARLPFAYLPFPALLWAGLRFGPIGAATMNLVVNAIAVLGTVQGFGPFAGASFNESLFLLWTFMGVASVTALVTAAISAERQQAKSILGQAEQAYRTLVAQVLQGIVVLQNGRPAFANPAIAQISGYSLEELHALSAEEVLALIHPDDRSRLAQAMQDRLSGKPGSPRQEYRFIHKDGTIRWLNALSNLTEYRSQAALQIVVLDITERVQAEQALRQSEARYRSVVEDTPVLLCRFQAGGIIEFVNAAYARAFGREPEELIGQSFLPLIPEEHRAALLAALDALLPESSVMTHEHPILAAGDEMRWQRWTNRLLTDEAGRTIAYQAFGEDITEHKQAEAALLASRSLLDGIYRAQTDFIAAGDRRSTFNDLLQLLLHLTDSNYGFIGEVLPDAQGQPYLRAHAITNIAWNEETRALYERSLLEGFEFHNLKTLFGAVITTGQAVIANHPAHDLRRGGLPHGHPPMHAFLGLPLHHAGHMVGMVGVANRPGGYDEKLAAELAPLLATCANLIEAMRNEASRRTAEARLRESEERFRQLAENINEVFWMTDPAKNQMLYISPAYEKIWGRTCESLYAAPRIWLEAIHPEDYERVLQAVTTKQTRGDYDETYRITRPDGSLRWIRDRAFPLRDAAGEVHRVVGTATDITEQRKLEEQFLQSQKMEAIGRLAGGIAHDFNNILVPIIGYTELGMMELSSDDKVYADLQRVREAAERAADLTRQILAFSRKQVLEMRTVDLNALVMDFQRMIQRLIGEDIEVRTFLDSALYYVKADKGQIEQVLLNLVVNARDAMLQGGKLTLETDNVYLDDAYLTKYADAQAPGHYVMLAVSDTGQGMDAETQQHIFEPFFTTKEQGKGTGLGLATVFGIVKQHGGNIWVYSELGKGTTFKMYLPQAGKTMPFAPGERTTPASVHGTETVLVVEDEDMVRELVGETLEAHGYKVIEAPGPEAGLQIAAGYQDIIHLLLTDVIMPEMNGRELYQKLAAIRSDIKVLYMSGYMDHAIVHHGILDEGVNFLQKPFTVQSLTRKVRQVLN